MSASLLKVLSITDSSLTTATISPLYARGYDDMPSRHPAIPTHLPLNADHLPRDESSPTIWLPSQVQNAVPSCAQSCLADYALQETDPSNICPSQDTDCLCEQTYTQFNYTLGELALLCVNETCPSPVETQSASAFLVCTQDPRAVNATHDPLGPLPPRSTVSIQGLSTSSPSPTSHTLSSTSAGPTATLTSSLSPRTSTSSIDPPPTSSSQLPPCTGTNTIHPTSCTITAANTSSAAATSNVAQGLTSSEAVGITVGAIVAVLLALAAAGLIFFFRRRRRKNRPTNHGSWDFVDASSPRASSPIRNHPAAGGNVNAFLPVENTDSSQRVARQSRWLPQWMQASQLQSHARSPSRGQNAPGSPESNYSVRTMSQLLPTHPENTQGTRSIPKEHDGTQASIPTFNPAVIAVADSNFLAPPGMSFNPTRKAPQPPMTASATAKQSQIDGTDPTRHPPLSLTIPKQSFRPDPVPSLGPWSLHTGPSSGVLSHTMPSAQMPEPATDSRLRSPGDAYAKPDKATPTSVLDFYAHATSPELYSSAPPVNLGFVSDSAPPLPSSAPVPALRIRKAVDDDREDIPMGPMAKRPAPFYQNTKQQQHPRNIQQVSTKLRHDSDASDTSFESTDDANRYFLPRRPVHNTFVSLDRPNEYDGKDERPIDHPIRGSGLTNPFDVDDDQQIESLTIPIAEVRYPRVPRPSNPPNSRTSMSTFQSQPQQQQRQEHLPHIWTTFPSSSSRPPTRGKPDHRERANPWPAANRSPTNSMHRGGTNTSVLKQKELRPLHLQPREYNDNVTESSRRASRRQGAPRAGIPIISRTPSPNVPQPEMLAKKDSRSPLLGREVRIGGNTGATPYSNGETPSTFPSATPRSVRPGHTRGPNRSQFQPFESQVIHIRMGEEGGYL